MKIASGGILKSGISMLFSVFLLFNCSAPSIKSHPATSIIAQVSPRDTIIISEMKFHPEKIIVHKGDTVVWINQDMVAHCVTAAGDKPWTSSTIPSGGSWKMAITESTGYFCAIHQVMKGEIVVE